MRRLILAFLALAAPAAAQQGTVPGERVTPPARPGQPLATIVAEPVALMIAACDADGDARVTRAELAPCVARSFATIDAGNKGSIGYIDFSDWALRYLGDRNALPSPFSVDADNNDRITLAELQDQVSRLFTRFDADKDGVATRAELLTIRSGSEGRGIGGRGKRGRGTPGQ